MKTTQIWTWHGIDRRTKEFKELRARRLWLVWLFIASILSCGIAMAVGKRLVFDEYPLNPMQESFEVRSLSPTPTTVPTPSNKPISHEKTKSNDPIDLIRRIGEELGYSNEVILTMIKIARVESTFKPYAKNPVSTASGLFQITRGTFNGSCKGDVFDVETNIRCAYKLYSKRGFQPWYSSSKNWL